MFLDTNFSANENAFNCMKKTEPKGEIPVYLIQQFVGFQPAELHFLDDVPPGPVVFINFVEEPIKFMLDLLLRKSGQIQDAPGDVVNPCSNQYKGGKVLE